MKLSFMADFVNTMDDTPICGHDGILRYLQRFLDDERPLCSFLWRFRKMGPPNGWFIMENPKSKMDDLIRGTPMTQETSIYRIQCGEFQNFSSVQKPVVPLSVFSVGYLILEDDPKSAG